MTGHLSERSRDRRLRKYSCHLNRVRIPLGSVIGFTANKVHLLSLSQRRLISGRSAISSASGGRIGGRSITGSLLGARLGSSNVGVVIGAILAVDSSVLLAVNGSHLLTLNIAVNVPAIFTTVVAVLITLIVGISVLALTRTKTLLVTIVVSCGLPVGRPAILPFVSTV